MGNELPSVDVRFGPARKGGEEDMPRIVGLIKKAPEGGRDIEISDEYVSQGAFSLRRVPCPVTLFGSKPTSLVETQSAHGDVRPTNVARNVQWTYASGRMDIGPTNVVSKFPSW